MLCYFFVVARSGSRKPRRKNSSLDCFCLSFGLTLLAQNLATSFSIPLISIQIKKELTFKLVPSGG